MNPTCWQFWIDVGGTFTDCLAQSPEGKISRHKLLSSGRTKGQCSSEFQPTEIVDLDRRNDPENFWAGFQVNFLDTQGQIVETNRVTRFDAASGLMILQSLRTSEATRYELSCQLPAPVLAIRYLLGCPLDQPLPNVSVRLGTTRGTNALLTRSGANTALVTTQGFGDLLKIGNQARPELFTLEIKKPTALFQTVCEIQERISADGMILTPLDLTQAKQKLNQLKEQGIESLAICLMHSYLNPKHEQQFKSLAQEIGFENISVSSEVVPLRNMVSRGDTTVVDAYLNPVLQDYVRDIQQSLSITSELQLMTSAGNLVDVAHFSGRDSILSGPAGGVVGFAAVAKSAGFSKSIGFDMGGTSTDVSRFDGQYCYEHETEKAGVRIMAPMMAIETVAAGGGSICAFDGVKLTVGPASAGSDPGPACYGRGGPLTVTDMNFYLGKILPERFPFPLDRQVVERKLIELVSQLKQQLEIDYSPQELAQGFLKIANQNMVKAIRSISISQGADPREYAMVAFGGAAPQHGCAVAQELGIKKILNHPQSGILSAFGIGQAKVAAHHVQGIYLQLTQEQVEQLKQTLQSLQQAAIEEVLDQGIPKSAIEVILTVELRYQGLESTLAQTVSLNSLNVDRLQQQYHQHHKQLYGYAQSEKLIELVTARAVVTGALQQELPDSHKCTNRKLESDRVCEIFFEDQVLPTKVFTRESLQPGDLITGPALIQEDISTTIIDPSWSAEVLSCGTLLITQTKRQLQKSISQELDPVMLEVFNNLFASIAQQMGITLQQTSCSVNVKERLDFSCALFTCEGDLVVNAPHIPVHLGAMGETVRGIIADNPMMKPGDVFVTNDPFRGGSHLPDVTVVTPVFNEAAELLFFTASRAHHAEIGGITPGSMPPFSKNLAQEGVLIRNFKIIDQGKSKEKELLNLLSTGEYPSRAPGDNWADIQAQIAANQLGASLLLQLVKRYTWEVVSCYMNWIQQAAEQKTKAALQELADGEHQFIDYLDDGTKIQVNILIAGDQATFDFTGSGPVSSGNLNANRAIVSAAVMYVMRLLINENIPLNQGVMKPVKLVLPESILSPPVAQNAKDCAAMVGGNVETSQRVVDVLLGALQLAAASQGTMNNLLFGDETFGYYETICGGSGATSKTPGADAVHTHMTNTRLTDPEVLESRFPIRLRQFSIRRESSGAGKHPGGQGIVRHFEFLKPLELSLLTQRRGSYMPYGINGGSPGAQGENLFKKQDDQEFQLLPAQVKQAVEEGDQLIIKTPGGGGWGKPNQS